MSHHTENTNKASMGGPPRPREWVGSDIREEGTAAELPKLEEAHERAGIGKLSIGSGSSKHAVKTCQVEVIMDGLSLTYCVPSSWRLCQGKEYAGFEVDEVPNTEILESLKSQYPGVEVCWESGVVQLRRSWVRHQVMLRGVCVELTVPCSWKLIPSSEYKCAFFAVEEKPEDDVLIQVQQQKELEGLEVQFLDGVVIVTMLTDPDSDRAFYFQKQFECYLGRRGMSGKWLYSGSSGLYSFSTGGKRFVPDFAVVDEILANKTRMEHVPSDVYRDVK